MSALAPEVFITRHEGHQSFDGGKFAGPPLDLTRLWVRLPGLGVSMVVDQQPTPRSGAGLPVEPKRVPPR